LALPLTSLPRAGFPMDSAIGRRARFRVQTCGALSFGRPTSFVVARVVAGLCIPLGHRRMVPAYLPRNLQMAFPTPVGPGRVPSA
jgi:hypothetical protein